MKTVRLALAGTGFIGRIHWICYRSAPGVYSSFPAQVVFDTLLTSHPEAAERYGFRCALPYEAAAEACKAVDMVDICTPNAAHRSLVETAISCHLPLYCEKPVDLDGEHALALARHAEEAGVFTQVALIYRFLPALAAARAAVRSGVIGDVVTWRTMLLHASYLNPERPMSWRLSRSESGGGALMDLGIHVIDAVRMVLGEFASVQCQTRTVIGERPCVGACDKQTTVDVDDWALVMASLADGSTGTVEVSRVAAGREGAFAFEVYGTKGSVTVDLARNRAIVMDAQSRDITENVTLEDPWLAYLRTAYPSPKMSLGLMCDMHSASIFTFLTGLCGGNVAYPERPTLLEAARTQQVLDACYRSADADRREDVRYLQEP